MSHSKPFKSDDVRHMEALHAELELKALEAQELMGDPTWRRVLRGLLANRASLAGAIILLFFAALATLAPILAPCPDDPRQQRRCGESSPNGPYGVPQYGYSTEPQPPSAEFRFGTTPKQYDIYYATVWGSRTAFKVGIVNIRANDEACVAAADDLYDRLAGAGVAEWRMTAVGFGQTRPVASNDSAAGKAANRRIEFFVLGGT